MGSKRGLLSKSPYFIWQGLVKGTRWEARAVCPDCARHFAPLDAEPPEVPEAPLPEWADLMLEDRGFIEDDDNPSTLRVLDVITNVPTEEKPEVEATLIGTTGCFIPGHDEVRVFWRKV